MRDEAAVVPAISAGMLHAFRLYGRYYVSRHFHAVRVLRDCDDAALRDWPVLVCLNHPSWWDPMIALTLSQERSFAGRNHYAPILDMALGKYRFFEKIGFFGIDPATLTGARRFLRIGAAALSGGGVLWVTAQGAFVDARRRPLDLAAGAGHLIRAVPRVVVLPLALEYPFWDERFPEALVNWGEPLLISDGHRRSPEAWTQTVATALTSACDTLAEAAMARRPDQFRVILHGASGVGGMYDLWRSALARIRGEAFRAQHGKEHF